LDEEANLKAILKENEDLQKGIAEVKGWVMRTS
jgi:hypothetical protein